MDPFDEHLPVDVARERVAVTLKNLGLNVSPDDKDLVKFVLANDPYFCWMSHGEQLLYAERWVRKLGHNEPVWALVEDPGLWGVFTQWLWTLVRPLTRDGQHAMRLLRQNGIKG